MKSNGTEVWLEVYMKKLPIWTMIAFQIVANILILREQCMFWLLQLLKRVMKCFLVMSAHYLVPQWDK